MLKALLTKHDFPSDLDALVNTFLGGQNFYVPSPLMPRSVADFAKQSFRYPVSMQSYHQIHWPRCFTQEGHVNLLPAMHHMQTRLSNDARSWTCMLHCFLASISVIPMMLAVSTCCVCSPLQNPPSTLRLPAFAISMHCFVLQTSTEFTVVSPAVAAF